MLLQLYYLCWMLLNAVTMWIYYLLIICSSLQSISLICHLIYFNYTVGGRGKKRQVDIARCLRRKSHLVELHGHLSVVRRVNHELQSSNSLSDIVKTYWVAPTLTVRCIVQQPARALRNPRYRFIGSFFKHNKEYLQQMDRESSETLHSVD